MRKRQISVFYLNSSVDLTHPVESFKARFSCYIDGDLGVDEAPTQKSGSCWACAYHLTGKNRVTRECVTPSEVFQQRLTQYNIYR